MAFSMSKKPGASVPPTRETEGRLYVNDLGKLVVRLSDGTEKEAQIPDGLPVFLENQATDPTAQANKYRVFSKTADGAANLHVRSPDGTVIQLTGGGGLKGVGGGTFFDTVVGQVEETFSDLNPSGEFTWNPGLNFDLSQITTGWALVPVWVELFASGTKQTQQGLGAALFVFLFSPGPGTPQSRISPVYAGYVEGAIAGYANAGFGYNGLAAYYNTVVNGDEMELLIDVNGWTATTQIHATAIMGSAIEVADPTLPELP